LWHFARLALAPINIRIFPAVGFPNYLDANELCSRETNLQAIFMNLSNLRNLFGFSATFITELPMLKFP
jgi:hypothetical protein